MFNLVTNAFLTLVQFFVRVFKKALCCLRRRRRLSGEPVPLTNIGIVPNSEKHEPDSQMWVSWEDTLTVVTSSKPVDPVQQQIELYRQQRMLSSNSQDDEEQKVDYFQDMTPRIVKQTKLLLVPKESEQSERSSNLSLAPDPVFNSSELGVWEETQSWEDQTQQDWDANDMIREKKRMDREKRLAEQQKKKLDRVSRMQSSGRQLPAVRLS